MTDFFWQTAALEVPIAPDVPIVDPHQHFWKGTEAADMFGNFEPSDMLEQINQSGHNIVATVYIECGQHYLPGGLEALRCVGETAFVETVGATHAAKGLSAAIMGHADLMLGNGAEAVLRAHMAASPTRFRGIRDILTADPDLPWDLPYGEHKAQDANFRAGFAVLARLGLSYEAWCVHPQLFELAELADAFPEVPIVLNHLGTPICVGRYAGRQADVFKEWQDGIDRLAQCANVWIKLGGLGMALTGLGLHGRLAAPGSIEIAETYHPFVDHAVAAFGASRSMFESNFPVDGGASGYGALWNAFKLLAADYGAAEQADLLCGTASRFYGLTAGEGAGQ